ncbi:uncharacterized protein LOC123875810 [Maniola jurtina]|uniref:uncharacterized protein LOC123875810 n=1 Tax=Maniola jurtina TaxID=191418 RepID=UPI001E6889EA|nr:uncharacterized protein LOC123875810 [Maniola jurtina]
MVNSMQLPNTAESDREILREYYLERNFFTSTEGVLKVLSIVVCTASSVLWLAGGGCGRGARLAGGASVASAAILVLLCAVDALRLAAYAPMTYFYTDIIVSTCIGLWLLISGVLSLAFCDAQRALDYAHGPLAVVNAGLVLGSAVTTYVSVIRRWDDARRQSPRAPRPSRFELDV